MCFQMEQRWRKLWPKKKRANEQEQEQIVFTLKANLDSTMKPTASYLRGLGAEGLARRLELLQRQGVLP